MAGSGQRSVSFSHRFSFQAELVGAVQEAVEDRIGQALDLLGLRLWPYPVRNPDKSAFVSGYNGLRQNPTRKSEMGTEGGGSGGA